MGNTTAFAVRCFEHENSK